MTKIKIIGSFVALCLVLSFIPFFDTQGSQWLYNNKVQATEKSYEMTPATDTADSTVLIDSQNKTLIYSKNAYTRRGMASTTKIMTALTVIENCHPDNEFFIPKEAVGVEGSSVYLVEGEPLTIRELLYCLLLESGNDSAVALSLACSGSLEEFVELMNQRALELGLKDTHFTNSHGLSDENHYTTAYDLAIITAEALKYPLFREIVSTKTMRVRYKGVENQRYLTNHNKLLFGFKGANGIKTGYTMKDGKCLVSSAERDGLEFICVTLHDTSPTYNHMRLLNQAFSEFELVTLPLSEDFVGTVPIDNLENSFLTVRSYQSGKIVIPKGEKIQAEIIIPETLNAPIYDGQIVGEIRFYHKEKEVYIINIEAEGDVLLPKKNFWEKIFGD